MAPSNRSRVSNPRKTHFGQKLFHAWQLSRFCLSYPIYISQLCLYCTCCSRHRSFFRAWFEAIFRSEKFVAICLIDWIGFDWIQLKIYWIRSIDVRSMCASLFVAYYSSCNAWGRLFFARFVDFFCVDTNSTKH